MEMFERHWSVNTGVSRDNEETTVTGVKDFLKGRSVGLGRGDSSCQPACGTWMLSVESC